MTDAATIAEPGRSTIVQSRVFGAPRPLVFRAWTDSKHLDAWWGPEGFSTTTHEMDFRKGGRWRFTMHGSNGVDYPNLIVYAEITAPERLAWVHSADEDDENAFTVVVEFEDLGERTKVTMRSDFGTVEARDYLIRNVGALEGGRQTLARLAEYLATMRG